MTASETATGQADADPQGNAVDRPDFISREVWEVVRLAAGLNKLGVVEYVEKALLDEALILEQERFGRRWLVEDRRGRTGRIDFA